MRIQSLMRAVLAAAGGSCATVTGFSIGMPAWLTAITGGVASLGLTLLLMESDHPQDINIASRTKEILAAATARVNTLESASQKLPAGMLVQVAQIVSTARALIRDFKQKPADIEVGQRFLTHYLDSTQTVVTSYRHLVERKSGQITPDVEAKMLGLLVTVAKNFNYQKENMLAGEVLRLKTEMEVLQRSMEMENS